MVEINILFTVANVLLLIASIPLLRDLVLYRDRLRGYNPHGALLTFVALLIFNYAYVLMENWWSIAVNASTVTFWGLAAWFSYWRG
ncbi:MAG: hypothetical protein KAJ19_29970 [Gammaproteobacteria bacterium]|nr:hypothetical protein [Gammaproteobacteria bacterium]